MGKKPLRKPAPCKRDARAPPKFQERGTKLAAANGMKTQDLATVARHLFETQGPQAIAEAAQKAADFEQAGDPQQAEFWHRVENLLREARGPRQT